MYLACPRDNAFLTVHVAIVHVQTIRARPHKKKTDIGTHKIELNVVSNGWHEKKEQGSKLFQSRYFLFFLPFLFQMHFEKLYRKENKINFDLNKHKA